MLKNTMFYC